MARCRPALLALLGLAAVAVSCRTPEDSARAALRARLKQEARLTPEELRRLYDQIAPVIAGKTLQVKEGAVTRTLDEQQRVTVLGVLTDPSAVYDAGMKAEGNATWRALKTGATPPHSEVDAMQTLWIDADNFLPRRYEFEYSIAGLGDYSYDLRFGP